MNRALILGTLFISCTNTKVVSFQPSENSYEYCQNGLDDDEDNWTDCADQDCSVFALCHKELPAPTTPPDQTEENKTLETCQDGKDNDEDGWVDCQDQDCIIYVACVEPNIIQPKDIVNQTAELEDATIIASIDVQSPNNKDTVNNFETDQTIIPSLPLDTIIVQNDIVNPATDTIQPSDEFISIKDAPLPTISEDVADTYDSEQIFWPLPGIDSADAINVIPPDSDQLSDVLIETSVFDVLSVSDTANPAIDLVSDDMQVVIETQAQETSSTVDASTDSSLPPIEEPEYVGEEGCEIFGTDNDDQDNDGLLNIDEYLLGTNPCSSDTDGDGIDDSNDTYPLGEDANLGGSINCPEFPEKIIPAIKVAAGQGFLIFPIKNPALIANGYEYSANPTSPFGNPVGVLHASVDFMVAENTSIYSVCDGYTIADISTSGGTNSYGLLVITRCDKTILDTNGVSHVLFVISAHLSSTSLPITIDARTSFHKKYLEYAKQGKAIHLNAGDFIGYSGKAGKNTSWAHLHQQAYFDCYGACNGQNLNHYHNAVDIYDIYAKTISSSCPSALYYPGNIFGCNFSECGENHLWKECPPIATCANTSCLQQNPYKTTTPGAYVPDNALFNTACSNKCPDGYSVCKFSSELCDNNMDDDNDGKIDCFDSDCIGANSCAPKIDSVSCDSYEQGAITTCLIKGKNFISTDNVWIECDAIKSNSKKLIDQTTLEVTVDWSCTNCIPGFKKAAYRHPDTPKQDYGCTNTLISSCLAKAVEIIDNCDPSQCGKNLCETKNCAPCADGYNCEYYALYQGECIAQFCKIGEGGGEDNCPCTPDCTNKQCGDDGCGSDCGSCNLIHALAKCVNYKCDIENCETGYNNCNTNAQDGCETAGPCGGCPLCTTLSGTTCVAITNNLACTSDNNACTTDACQDGQCKHIGMICNSPQANECVGNSLRVYNNAGACANGICSYSYTDTLCQFGCMGKQCSGNPCSGISCLNPPVNECIFNSLRVYNNAGACNNGLCTYSFTDTLCQFGCANKQCSGDPCSGISCLNPPAPTCKLNKKVVYTTPGICSNGNCTYSPLEISCDDNDACTTDSCEKEDCSNVPKICALTHANANCSNNICVIASCEVGYNDCNNNPTDGCETIGPCGGCPECTTLSGTNCVKAQNMTVCSSDNKPCTNDFCNEGVCQHVAINCNSQKPNECQDATTLKIWDPQGVCSNGSCVFNDYTLQNCNYGCLDDKCNGDPCNGVSCNSPPAPYCNNSNVSKVIYNSPGVCSWGICNYNSYNEISCIDSSNCTDDYCVGGDCINPQKTNTCGSKQCGWSSDGCFSCGTCQQGECDANGQCVVKECNPGDTDWQMCDPTPGQFDYCFFEQTKTCNAQGKWNSWGVCQGDQYWYPYEYSTETSCGNTICITINDIDANGNVTGYIDRKDGAKWGDYYIEWSIKDDKGTLLDEPFPGDHCFPAYKNAYTISFDFNAQKLSLGVSSFAKIQATVQKGGSGITNCSTYTMKSDEATIQRCF